MTHPKGSARTSGPCYLQPGRRGHVVTPGLPITGRSPVPLEACQSRPRMSVAMTLPLVPPCLPSSRSCWPDGPLMKTATYYVLYCLPPAPVGSSLGICPRDLPQELRSHTRCPGHQARGHSMCLVPSHPQAPACEQLVSNMPPRASLCPQVRIFGGR